MQPAINPIAEPVKDDPMTILVITAPLSQQGLLLDTWNEKRIKAGLDDGYAVIHLGPPVDRKAEALSDALAHLEKLEPDKDATLQAEREAVVEAAQGALSDPVPVLQVDLTK